MSKLRPKLRIIEGVSADDRGQDAPIQEEIAKMTRMDHEVIEIDEEDAVGQFLSMLFSGRPRFIHISAHGDGNAIEVGPNGSEVDWCGIESSSGSLKGQFITLSACSSLSGRFAQALHKKGASAVVSPTMVVSFDESAIFAAMFYFSLYRCPGLSEASPAAVESDKTTSARISQYVDTFQRTKAGYLGLGGKGAHRLSYSHGGECEAIY